HPDGPQRRPAAGRGGGSWNCAPCAARPWGGVRIESHVRAAPRHAITGQMSLTPPSWIVLKFGGTSVSQRARWDAIGRIATSRASEEDVRVLVVVSALSGVTNALQAIADGAEARSGIAALVARHREFAGALGLDADAVLGVRLAALDALAADPRAACRTLDWQAEVLAQGELLSSTLGAAYLRGQGLDFGWCDARDWLQALALPNQNDWTTRLCVSCDFQP